jgi:hypothetical protein
LFLNVESATIFLAQFGDSQGLRVVGGVREKGRSVGSGSVGVLGGCVVSAKCSQKSERPSVTCFRFDCDTPSPTVSVVSSYAPSVRCNVCRPPTPAALLSVGVCVCVCTCMRVHVCACTYTCVHARSCVFTPPPPPSPCGERAHFGGRGTATRAFSFSL